MPGLRLTVEQVRRLCGVERGACQIVLDALVDAKFLCLKADGAYARVTDGGIQHLQPAPAAEHQSLEFSEGLMARTPERRRQRSDTELRRQRQQLERLW